MSNRGQHNLLYSKRVDLHCHSHASTEADEAVLQAIRCPESYSRPAEIHAQATRRGMDFVTITDHDSIAGVAELRDVPNVFVGEELTCYFREDHCKIHLLVWGIDQADHDRLQAAADDIERVARFITERNIAHAVAHPLYRQNDKLDRWHMERLALLFRGFECLNGAHSMGHREALEPFIDNLDPGEIRRLERLHGMGALWPKPWAKVRTGGSDDHGLFNIGRTWTEFPEDVTTTDQVLDCLRDGRCRPGGEAGSSIKLAHNFFGVGIRYYTREVAPSSGGIKADFLRRCVGDKPIRGRVATASGIAAAGAKRIVAKLSRAVGVAPQPTGTELLGELLASAAWSRFRRNMPMGREFLSGGVPLAEHESIFDFVSGLQRDVTAGIHQAISKAGKSGQLGGLFDAISTIAAGQALLAPYYFALFHQNQERHLLGRMTGRPPEYHAGNVRVGLFSDSGNTTDGPGRFAADLENFAGGRGLQLAVAALGDKPATGNLRRNFTPLATQRWPGSPPGSSAELKLPPLLDLLNWADRKQFDVVLVNSCGPMALCGWLAAKMLRVPLVAVCHDDLASNIMGWTAGDYRVTAAATGFARWFYARPAENAVIARSRAGQAVLQQLGIATEKIVVLPPTPHAPEAGDCSTETFWHRRRIYQQMRLVCPGNLAAKKDVQLIADAFRAVCRRRQDVALIVIGEGRWADFLRESASGLPVFVFPSDKADPAELCSRGDLLLHPDRCDVAGQMVTDAQAAGVPALVSEAGAGKEFIDDGLTGRVLPAENADAWSIAILEILGDETHRLKLSRTARQRCGRLNPERALELVWDACLRTISPDPTSPASGCPGEGWGGGYLHRKSREQPPPSPSPGVPEGEKHGIRSIGCSRNGGIRMMPSLKERVKSRVRTGRWKSPTAPLPMESLPSRPHIVILSASVGSGHIRAAQAVADALAQILPDAFIAHIDVLQLTNKVFRKTYGDGYFRAAQRAPRLVGWMYDFLDHAGDAGITTKARLAVERLNFRRVTRLLTRQPWDLAINTHFLPAALIARLRASGAVEFPQATVVTDFDVHGMWIQPDVQRFYVATPEAQANAIAGGVSPDRIAVTGIPIDPRFGEPRDRVEIIRQLGLSPDRPIVLQLAGGFGIGSIERIHQLISQIEIPLQIVVVTGKNTEAQQALTAIDHHPRHQRRILGYTQQMHDLMLAADAVVSKPGGLTTSECLASGCAMVVVEPIPGQEDRNADYLLENGCAIKVNNLASLTHKLGGLLGDPARLAAMRTASHNHGRPRAAFDIAADSAAILKPARETPAWSI